DVNDRNLRHIVTGLGGNANGVPTETGFDITPASEIMAILCLSKDLDDLRERLDNILIGYTTENQPFFVKNLKIGGALTVLLKDALQPNLVQTTEHTPAFVHGGPFANIAHGCNSLIATKMALSTGDYVITEAGFGADLGAEKFFDIKCRLGELQPKVSVLVVTSQALKLHGFVPEPEIKQPHLEGLKRGLENVQRHLKNLQHFGQTVVVAFNQYHFDTEDEISYLRNWCAENGARFALNNGFLKGGEGATELAQAVLDAIAEAPAKPLQFVYNLDDAPEEKIEKVVKQIYGGRSVTYSSSARAMLHRIKRLGFDKLPVCIAKTQYSFSDDATQIGAVSDFEFNVQDLIIQAGAGFIVAVAGNIMRMPGLPKSPQAERIDLVNGLIEGLS
ncbi:MAG: formate--tetrahydrofolate ligase, partial [Hymenobacteraceae bacterium]|nr:formate--tetrahydrofolate ligase [Hymenobacteraceae bacterium]MDX5395881.1 formate--tetrahydrofolate ligase [Hymenobacteraceae bacterium]MDX5511936.1 formate--tetrahydrofolate ligase [Hymenobacteraceae bacterium]